ncbi:nitrate reductase molybdenum cofactor assembly chaperone [Simplicispira suum]|uniref:Nitrate reductase molybdenum cofactor assembly chaperone n=1 Tax=Simplicispira suum TaxID=2109915 RepID=A0A2S0MZY8_9BURK|nr:nitrate reductase molybdenum cofactor assembly chaperone [Simplicispira suum]AVO41458.1 nitrate reductase molybdenum cofactor assembly chaperone [Simplicispira suum]MBW7833776.1 nitrate reductase molybdenum cofactor assembly chaperone [Simplicispira suum]
MALFNHTPHASKSLRVLARLLGYPDADLRTHLPELRAALHEEKALAAPRLAELEALIETLSRKAVLDIESDYVELFDRGRATSLHLFEHVHGDSRDRGPAMIDLAKTYEQTGLFLGEGELPDFLPVVLEFTSTLAPRQAREFLSEMAHIFNAIFAALQQRESPYAAVLGALLELSGEKASPVDIAPEESIDAVWEEPVVFDGCSSKGQARPDQAQPIHIVPKSARQALSSLGAQP